MNTFSAKVVPGRFVNELLTVAKLEQKTRGHSKQAITPGVATLSSM